MPKYLQCLPLLVLIVTSCGPPTSLDNTLTVALPPGRIDDFNRVIAPGFKALSDVSITVIGMRSADQVARVRIEQDRPTLDLLWIDFAEAQLLAREGLLAKVSERELPNLRDIREEAKSTLGVAPITFSSALGFLYNSTRIKHPPRSWADLWNSRFEGELALFDFGSSLGPVTLVMAARLNGGNETNIDPGFEKLFQLKSNAFGFRTSGPENNKFVAQGEAGVTLALASQTRELKAAGATVEWIVPAEGAVALPQGFQIVAGSPQRALAQTFVNYVLSLEVQQRLANDLLMVVPHRKVVLDPVIAPFVPLDNILYLDIETIGMRRGEWTNRFNREILGG